MLTCKIYPKLIEGKKFSEFYFFPPHTFTIDYICIVSIWTVVFVLVLQKTSANMLLCIVLLLYHNNFLSWITPAFLIFSLCFLLSFADPYFIFNPSIFFHLSLCLSHSVHPVLNHVCIAKITNSSPLLTFHLFFLEM